MSIWLLSRGQSKSVWEVAPRGVGIRWCAKLDHEMHCSLPIYCLRFLMREQSGREWGATARGTPNTLTPSPCLGPHPLLMPRQGQRSPSPRSLSAICANSSQWSGIWGTPTPLLPLGGLSPTEARLEISGYALGPEGPRRDNRRGARQGPSPGPSVQPARPPVPRRP